MFPLIYLFYSEPNTELNIKRKCLDCTQEIKSLIQCVLTLLLISICVVASIDYCRIDPFSNCLFG